MQKPRPARVWCAFLTALGDRDTMPYHVRGAFADYDQLLASVAAEIRRQMPKAPRRKDPRKAIAAFFGLLDPNDLDPESKHFYNGARQTTYGGHGHPTHTLTIWPIPVGEMVPEFP
jgi:hypothetical protein